MERKTKGREGSVPMAERRAVGMLTRHADGGFSGLLRTLLVRTQLELRPVPGDEGHGTYEVYANADFRFGTAYAGPPDEAPFLTLDLAAPELPASVRLIAVPEGEDTLKLLWDAPPAY